MLYPAIGYFNPNDILILLTNLYFIALALGHLCITTYNLSSFEEAWNTFFSDWDVFCKNYTVGFATKAFYIFLYNVAGYLLFYLGISFLSPEFVAVFLPLTIFRVVVVLLTTPVQAYYEELLFRYSVHNFLDDIWAACGIEYIIHNKAMMNSFISGVLFGVYHYPWFSGISYFDFMFFAMYHCAIGFWWGMMYEDTKNNYSSGSASLGVTSAVHFCHNLYQQLFHQYDSFSFGVNNKLVSGGVSAIFLSLWSLCNYMFLSVEYFIYRHVKSTLSVLPSYDYRVPQDIATAKPASTGKRIDSSEAERFQYLNRNTEAGVDISLVQSMQV